jgi:hypothetical protein
MTKRAKSLNHMGLYHCFWKYRIPIKKSAIPMDTSSLRLVLGVGRSGTTWINRTLAKSSTPMVCLEEPMYHVIPTLCLSTGGDHTAIPFSLKINEKNVRLISTYRMLTSKSCRHQLLKIRSFPLHREDPNPKVMLIKEVHSLMATEFLAVELACPIILIKRNFITVTDSLMNFTGLDEPYLHGEFRNLLWLFFYCSKCLI